MNDIIKYFIRFLASSTQSLKKRGILVEKPWALLDDDGEIQKLIFKRDKGLVLSKNGVVTEGSWDYYPEAKSLFINRSTDKLLLNEQYIDENVLILKKDGTKNELFALANENTIPDLNIPKYLNEVRREKMRIRQIKLLSGENIQIHCKSKVSSPNQYIGNLVERIGDDYKVIDISDGKYLTAQKDQTICIKDGAVIRANNNVVFKLYDGNTIEIENGSYDYIYPNINQSVTIGGELISEGNFLSKSKRNTFYVENFKITKLTLNIIIQLKGDETLEIEDGSLENLSANIHKRATINGKPIGSARLKIPKRFHTYIVIEDSIVNDIVYERTYELRDNKKITVEQRVVNFICKGDKIINSEPVHPLPDGSYKIKGKFFKIKVKDCTIV